MQLQWVNISEVKPYFQNPRKRSDISIRKIAASLNEFGWQQPLVVDKDLVVIAGHGRRDGAALLISEKAKSYLSRYNETVPVVIATHLTPEQVTAYRIADNRTAQETEWDNDLLKLEFKGLLDRAYDLSNTAFNDDEIKALLEDLKPPTDGNTDPDAVPDAPFEEAITQRGDVWVLGDHRLICGDATSREDLTRLLGGAEVQMVYTDPPYGVEIVNTDGKVSSGLPPGPALRGKVGGDKAFGKVGNIHNGMKAKPIIEANTYAPIIGDDSTETAIKSYQLCASLKPVPVLIFWGGNYYASALPDSSCWIVWDKDNGQSFFADAELAWTNQKTAVRICKHQWNGLIKASERGQKRVHPTQKPVAVAEWCFERYGKQGDNVLDLFGGSGSTLIACEKQHRRCFMSEMAEHYVDVIIRRWQEFTKRDARHEDGRTFEEVSRSRRAN
jgi:ParB-like chromosome segregation protein Spo0J